MAGTLTLPPTLSLGAAAAARPRRFLTAAVLAPAPARSRSLYDVLRIKENASVVEIKAAYRAMAKRVHPDVAAAAVPVTDEAFLELRRAYETLSDPRARATYDRSIGCCFWAHRLQRWETDQCW